MKLKGKVALITGGTGGIGRAIGKRYAEEGAIVVLADLDRGATEKAAAAIGSGAYGLAIDVTRRESIEAAVEAVALRSGGIDILVNNAAIFDMAPIVEVSEASYDQVFAVNVKGLFFMLQAAAKASCFRRRRRR
jgi:NAD(P)-dependent dehydrogenase (short-subunit alcohol dehydrogenase family)